MAIREREAQPPRIDQLTNWNITLKRVQQEQLSRCVYGDISLILRRIYMSTLMNSSLQGGCAFRLLMIRSRFLALEPLTPGDVNVAADLYEVAREMIQYEDRPDPRWGVMLEMFRLPPDPLPSESD